MENNLPQGWAKCSLIDLCSKPQYGWTSKAGGSGVVKYLRTTDISKGDVAWDLVPYCVEEPNEVQKYQVKKDDILVSRAGSVGFNHRIKDDVPFDAVFASYLIRFQPYDETLAHYIEYFLKSEEYWSQISDFTAGIAIPNVNASKLEQLDIPLPPECEIKRIIDKLDSLFDKIETNKKRLQKIPQILKRFRQSVLADAVSGNLTEDWREKQGRGSEWALKKLGECGSITGGLTLNSKRELYPLKMPYLRVGNVYSNRIILDVIKTIGVAENEINRTLLCKDDLLIVEGNGSADQIGRVAQWNEEIPNCLHQNHLIKFRSNHVNNPRYILYFLLSIYGREQIEEASKSTSGLYTLSLSKVSGLSIPIPSLEEQNEIVNLVERLLLFADKIESRYLKAKAQLDKLPQSILAKAFRGELVPQDSDEEPANLLLDRILAAKRIKK